MKRALGFLLSFCSCLFVSGQESFIQRSYYDQPQTQIKEIITLSANDSALHGPYLLFYQNGSLQMEGHYEHGVTDGLWIFYFENGQKKSEGKYSQGKQTGIWKYYYEKGNLKARGMMQDDVKQGEWIFYYENGEEKSTGAYLNDLKHNIWNYFYEDGTLKAQAYYENGTGYYKEFYSTGSLKVQGRNVDGVSEGPWIYYYESGEPEARGEFSRGRRTGPWKYYHKNGEVSAEGRFQEGQKTGLWKYFYPDGTVNSEGNMEKDRKEGDWKLYYQTGSLRGEGQFDGGTGEFVEYHPNGSQKARGKIVDGKKEGTWVYFTEDGQKEGEAFFREGNGEYRGYYPNDSLKMKGKIADDKRIGSWTLYNPDGSVAGVYKPIYENDKPIFRTKELNDPPDDPRHLSDKPEYRFKNKKIRYFNPRINEYVGGIIGTNPLWIPLGQLPLAMELYIQERQGYEMELTWFRDPFFRTNKNIPYDRLYTRGGMVEIRQKFYHRDTPVGMFYFGHQLSGSYLVHAVNHLDDMAVPDATEVMLRAEEQRYAYGLLVGNRWMERTADSGFTLDIHLGIGVGRRTYTERFSPTSSNRAFFDELNQSNLYLPVIFGINIGYAAPKRRTTSF